MDELRSAVRDIPDFPKPGILFKDITPLLQDARLFAQAIDLMAERVAPRRPTQVVAIESRGFLFGAPLAVKLGAGLVIVRKPNKLPFKTQKLEYALEYGTDTLEMHVDALKADDRVVIVDDLLATGGTALATAQLVEKIGARVGALVFFSELAFLNGREKLSGYTVETLVEF
ncbi:MAG: adenine phosphoribosyltransferase [Bdellovibrionales bacterium]|nr:adenine phosphoribosyltransferase [Bdellovibrionales bacterium]